MYIPSLNAIRTEVKFAWQRVFRGYDDSVRNGWGLDTYFIQIIPSIKSFCEYELDEQVKYNNPDSLRKEIFETTLHLISEYEKMTDKEECQPHNQLNTLFEYISCHCGWYWN